MRQKNVEDCCPLRKTGRLPFELVFQVVPCGPGEIQDIRNDERDGAGEEYGLVHAEMPCH